MPAKLTPWLIDPNADWCCMRCIEGSDPTDISTRVAFIEKTPRVRIAPLDPSKRWTEDCFNWRGGPKGNAPEYGHYQPSRDWCDEQLRELGYILPEDEAHGAD